MEFASHGSLHALSCYDAHHERPYTFILIIFPGCMWLLSYLTCIPNATKDSLLGTVTQISAGPGSHREEWCMTWLHFQTNKLLSMLLVLVALHVSISEGELTCLLSGFCLL